MDEGTFRLRARAVVVRRDSADPVHGRAHSVAFVRSVGRRRIDPVVGDAAPHGGRGSQAGIVWQASISFAPSGGVRWTSQTLRFRSCSSVPRWPCSAWGFSCSAAVVPGDRRTDSRRHVHRFRRDHRDAHRFLPRSGGRTVMDAETFVTGITSAWTLGVLCGLFYRIVRR